MAVDTPVLERPTNEKLRECAVPSRLDFMAEEEHNARIKDTYARLINPENKIEDVFNSARKESAVQTQEQIEAKPTEAVRPYFVENARANADIFRADSAINSRVAEAATVKAEESAVQAMEEEDEELRPTPTTIQYQTIGKPAVEKQTASSVRHNEKSFTFGKREKIIVAVFLAVVVALVVLIIVNSTIISGLNADISKVQDSITTVRGALAGVNSTVEEIINNSMGH